MAGRGKQFREVLKQPGVIISPGVHDGYSTRLVEAGAAIAPPTCGGGHMGVLEEQEVCITSSTRNFKGRMGAPSSREYMASPATVAAYAIVGTISDPRNFLD